MSVISSHPFILRWNMNLGSTVWHSGTQGACLLSNPFYNRRMNRPMSWKTRSVFLFHFCFVIVVNFYGHFINLIVGHKASWFEIFLFVDHLCQILLLGKLLNQSSGFCSSGFTTVSYLHVTYANCVNLMEISEKCMFHITPQNWIKKILCFVTLYSWQMHFSLPNPFCSAKKTPQFDYCKIIVCKVTLCFLM